MGIRASSLKARQRAAAVSRRGLTLIETALALAIMALIVASLSLMMADNADQVRAHAAADKMTEVHEASKSYIKANYAALLAATAAGPVVIPSGRPTATAPVPNGPSASLKSLQGGGYLNSGYIDTNGYGQRHSLIVRRIAGSTTDLEAIVTTTGGRPIPDRQLPRIANFVGAAGGYVPATPVVAADSGKVVGSYGGWRTATSGWGSITPSAGSIQSTLAFDDGTLLTDYLYRNDIGIPEANRMNTAIDMNGNDLNGARTVNTGILNATGNANVGGDVIVAGNVRATIDVWARDVNASRNVKATNDVTAGNNVTAGMDVTAGRDVKATNDVTAGRDVLATRDLKAGRNALVSGTLEVAGRSKLKDISCGGVAGDPTNVAGPCYLDTNYVVYTGAEDTSRGLTKGQALTLGDLLPRTVTQYSYRVLDGQEVPKPTCKGGYSKARIMVYRQTESNRMTPVIGLNKSRSDGYLTDVTQNAGTSYVDSTDGVFATDNDPARPTWTVNWVGTPPAGTPGSEIPRQALAQTFCYYG